MRLIAKITSGALLAAFPAAVHAEGWICIADQATGFIYDAAAQKWKSTTFRVDSSRYLIRRPEGRTSAWEVREFGNPSDVLASAWCKNETNEAGFLFCGGLWRDFVFNAINNRYILTFQGSYITYNPMAQLEVLRKDGGDTPYIEIGTCSPL